MSHFDQRGQRVDNQTNVAYDDSTSHVIMGLLVMSLVFQMLLFGYARALGSGNAFAILICLFCPPLFFLHAVFSFAYGHAKRDRTIKRLSLAAAGILPALVALGFVWQLIVGVIAGEIP